MYCNEVSYGLQHSYSCLAYKWEKESQLKLKVNKDEGHCSKQGLQELIYPTVVHSSNTLQGFHCKGLGHNVVGAREWSAAVYHVMSGSIMMDHYEGANSAASR